MRILLTLLAGAAVASVAASSAFAGGPEASFALTPVHYDPSLSATKSYFVVVARPGSTFKNSIRVSNAGTKTGTAYLYSVDATTGQTSGAVYLDRRAPQRSVGAWISLSVRSVTLAPKQSRVVSFVIRVPRSVRPGDHLGGIVAENAHIQSSPHKGALQVNIRHLTIAAVEVQVPGAAQARLEVAGIRASGEHGYQYVYLKLRNAGALTMKPSGTLSIVTSAGKSVASRHLQLDTFLPGTAIDYPVLLPAKALAAGSYQATLEMTYGASPLGYRSKDGGQSRISRQLSFTVSKHAQTEVFRGVAPVSRPQAALIAQHSTNPRTWPLFVAALAALLAAVAIALVIVRRLPFRQ